MAETVDTPTAILTCATAFLREHTFDDISYRILGDAVGVSERTVYRQFPTRSHLLEALGQQLEETDFPLRACATIPEFIDAATARFHAFDEAPAFAFVCARAASLPPTGETEPTFLTRTILALLESAHPFLNTRDLHRVAATLRCFAAAQFWARMRTGFAMNALEITEVFESTVLQALDNLPTVMHTRDHPYPAMTDPLPEEIYSGPDLNRTQTAILPAYAALIEELGTDDVGFRAIARRAGVGERTVFRNYATRIDLLLATAAWIERTLFAREDPPSVFDLPLAIREAMETYDQKPGLAHVVAETTMRGVSGAAPSPRQEHVDGLLRREVPTLDDGSRRAIVAALSHLDSAATWVTLRREFGMNRRDIADAASWAAEAVLDPIRERVG